MPESEERKSSSNLIAYVILGASVLLLFYQVFFDDVIIAKGLGDNLTGNFPYQVFLSEHLKTGLLPLWTSQIFMGFPIAAEAVAGSFNFVLRGFFHLFDPYRALNYTTIVSFFFAALGVFFLSMKFGLSKRGSVIASLTWISSSYFLTISDSVLIVTSALWTPWILLGFLRLSSSRSLSNLALLSLLIGLQMLVMYTQYSVITLITGIMIYFRQLRVANQRIGGRELLLPMIAVMLGMGLAAVQILPTAEFALYSPRLSSNIALGVASTMTPWSGLTGLLLPQLLQGMPPQFGGTGLYIGVLPLFFALFAMIKGRPKTNFLIAIFVFFLILALGKYTPIYYLTSQLPVFSIFRFPEHYLLISTLALSLLAGLGFDRLSHLESTREEAKRLVKILLVFSTVIVGLIIVSYVLISVATPFISEFVRDQVKSRIAGTSGHPFTLEEYFHRIDLMIRIFLSKLSPWNPFTFITILLLLGLVVSVAAFFWRKLSRKALYGVILTLMLINIGATAWTIPLLKFVDYGMLKKSPVANYLNEKRETGKFRIYSWPHRNKIQELLTYEAQTGRVNRGVKFAVDLLPVQINMLYDLESIDGFTSLWDDRIKHVMDKIEKANTALTEDEKLKKLPQSISLLGLFNVRYLLVQSEVRYPQLRKEARINGTYIYRNMEVLPRAFLVGDYKVAKGRDVLDSLFERSFNPRKSVFLETDPDIKIEKSAAKITPRDARIVEYRPHKVAVEVQAKRNAILVLSDALYPGWNVKIDGKSAPLLRANYILRAVPVTKGKHRVEFSYKNTYLRAGLILSGASMIVILILCAYALFSSKRR